MNLDDSVSFLDFLIQAIQRAGAYNKNDQAPPPPSSGLIKWANNSPGVQADQ